MAYSFVRLLFIRALATAFTAGLALAGAVHAQTFPGKPVRLVVPFGPGGSSDVVARIVADGAGEALGQPVLIENVPGAGGNIGTARTAKAAPDGYTLVECTIGTCAINPSISRGAPYRCRYWFAFMPIQFAADMAPNGARHVWKPVARPPPRAPRPSAANVDSQTVRKQST